MPDLSRSPRPSLIMRSYCSFVACASGRLRPSLRASASAILVFGGVRGVENLKESIALRSAQAPWRDSVLQSWGLQPVALRARTNLENRNPAQNQNNASASKPSARFASGLAEDRRLLRCFALQRKV